jgi:hypothetical protein
MDTAAHPDKAEREKEETEAKRKEERKERAVTMVDWATLISKLKTYAMLKLKHGSKAINVDGVAPDPLDMIDMTLMLSILVSFGMALPSCPKTLSEALAKLEAESKKEAVDGKENAKV